MFFLLCLLLQWTSPRSRYEPHLYRVSLHASHLGQVHQNLDPSTKLTYDDGKKNDIPVKKNCIF